MAHTLISAGSDGVYIDVHVQPRARRPGVRGIHGDRLKIAVTEPPEGGRANKATVRLIARALEVKPGDVSLVAGARSRDKRLFVAGLNGHLAQRLIEKAIEGSA
ncbi:MAG TPA: DUF167 domain-containing protein [Acidimicrobiia bacterium]